MCKCSRMLSALLTVAICSTIGQVIAHTGAIGIVKERMEAMKTLGNHAKVVGDMLKGKAAFELGSVAAAASAFIEHGEHIPMLFPDTAESRNGSKTEALPAIWTDWDDFASLAKQFTEDSRELAALVDGLSTGTQSTDEQIRAVRGAFFRASKGCSGCHERFRLDQD